MWTWRGGCATNYVVPQVGFRRLEQGLHAERLKRWRGTLPRLWREQARVLCRWIETEGTTWGTLPILAPDGTQCTSPQAVDAQVRAF